MTLNRQLIHCRPSSVLRADLRDGNGITAKAKRASAADVKIQCIERGAGLASDAQPAEPSEPVIGAGNFGVVHANQLAVIQPGHKEGDGDAGRLA